MIEKLKIALKTNSIQFRLTSIFIFFVLLTALGIIIGTLWFGVENGLKQAANQLTLNAHSQVLEIAALKTQLQNKLDFTLNERYTHARITTLLDFQAEEKYSQYYEGAILESFLISLQQSSQILDFYVVNNDCQVILSTDEDAAGENLEFGLITPSTDEIGKLCEVLKEQFENIGVNIEIQILESGVADQALGSGEYDLGIGQFGYGEADLMFFMFHSSMIDVLNFARVNDPDLDELLMLSKTETDPESRQDVVNQIQQYIVENAVVVPIVTPLVYQAVNNRVKDYTFIPGTDIIMLFNAYIEE